MRVFHIHIDGHCVPDDAQRAIASLPFVDTPFRRDLMGDGFEAPFHLTHKSIDPRAHKAAYATAESALKATGFDGYLEAECLAYDIDITAGEANDGPDALEGIETAFEDLGDGDFRDTELHIAFAQGSDEEAVAKLKSLGFFSAFMDKEYGLSEILTLQGRSQAIRVLEMPVRRYLESRTRLRHCSIKREDITRFWLSRPDIKRAPVLYRVERR